MLKDIEFQWPITRMVLNHVYKWSSDLTAQFIKLRYYLADYSILESLSEVLCSYRSLYYPILNSLFKSPDHIYNVNRLEIASRNRNFLNQANFQRVVPLS